MRGPPDIFLPAALEALEAGAKAAMRRFRRLESVERKDDGTPVTIADKEAEEAIVRVLTGAFPSHGLLGEEGGAREGDGAHRWIIDPIDGTRAYARGATHWGPMIALERDGELILGAAALPALEQTFWAVKGGGALCNGAHIGVTTTARWDEAILNLGGIGRLLRSDVREGTLALTESAPYCYAGNDLLGGLSVAMGRADAWIEHGAKVWDLAALKVIVEEAGGRATSFSGAEDIEGGSMVATNGTLHEFTLRTLNG